METSTRSSPCSIPTSWSAWTRAAGPSSRFAAPRTSPAERSAASQRDGLVGRPALINGAAGWVSVLDGELYAIAALTVHNGRITTMDILLDPARLARLDPTDFLTDFDSRL